METLKEVGFVVAGCLGLGWIAVFALSMRDALAGLPVSNPLAKGKGHHFPGSGRLAWWHYLLLSPLFAVFAIGFSFLLLIFIPPEYLVWRLSQWRSTVKEPIQPPQTTTGSSAPDRV